MLQIRYFRIHNGQTLLQIFLQHFCKGLMVVYAISGLSASLVSSVEIWVNGWKFLSVVANPAHAKCGFVLPSFIDLLSFLLSFLHLFVSFILQLQSNIFPPSLSRSRTTYGKGSFLQRKRYILSISYRGNILSLIKKMSKDSAQVQT